MVNEVGESPVRFSTYFIFEYGECILIALHLINTLL